MGVAIQWLKSKTLVLQREDLVPSYLNVVGLSQTAFASKNLLKACFTISCIDHVYRF